MKKRFSTNYNKVLKWYVLNFYVTKHKTLTCIFKSYLPWDKTFDLGCKFYYTPPNVDHTGIEIVLDLIFFGLDIEFFDRRHIEDYERIKNKRFEDNFIFDCATDFCNHKALAKHGDNWYEIGKGCHLTKLNLKYDSIYSYENEPYLHIEQNNKYGIMDIDYNVIIEPEYDEELSILNNNAFVVKQRGKYGVIDCNKKVLIPFDYSNLTPCNNRENLIATLQSVDDIRKCGVIDIKGNVIIPFEYDLLKEYQNKNGIFIAGKSYHTKGIINLENEVIIPFEKNCHIHELSDETFIRVKCGLNDEYYIYDFSNKKVCNTKFKFIKNNSYGIDLFEATKDFENWGYIDKYGKTKIGFKYKETEEFEKGYVQVAQDMNRHNFGLINKKGKLILPFEYDYGFEPVDDGEMFIVIKDGKYGIVDRKNKVVIDFQYDYITQTRGCYLAEQDGKLGYFHEYFGTVITNPNLNTHHQDYLE